MHNFTRFCYSLKSVLSKVQFFKYNRKFCSHTNCIKEAIKSESVQKYFNHIQKNGLIDIFKSNKFHIDSLLQERTEVLSNLLSLTDLEKSSKDEEDFLKMINEERVQLQDQLSAIEIKLLDGLAPDLPNSNNVIVEINAGVGGKEAMLFANDLKEMYLSYLCYKNWSVTFLDSETEEIGGLRHCTIFVEGRGVGEHLRCESGIHRVQRVPVTEKYGRVHTSTVSVVILPMPSEIEVRLNEKDLQIDTMRSSGAGGQHVNKTESAVRITHLPTGIVVECQTDRSQIKNREIAKQKLCAKLYELQQQKQTASIHQSRKAQVGSSARSDKIRTYNFPQDRITDHRIGRTLHHLPTFLEGGGLLDSLIKELILFSNNERISSFILSLNDKSNSGS